MGTQLQLSGQQVLVALSEMQLDQEEITLEGVSYHIREKIEMPAFLSRFSGYPGALIVLPDYSHLEDLVRRVNEAFAGRASCNLMYYTATICPQSRRRRITTRCGRIFCKP